MSTTPSLSCQATRRQRPHAQHCIVDLVINIVTKGDREALAELHNHRQVCHHEECGRLLLSDYIRFLADRARDRVTAATAERAYDLTVDKFSRLPGDGAPGKGQSGVDCRHYFGAYLTHLEVRIGLVHNYACPGAEEKAAEALQRTVLHHFHHSLSESLRTQGKTRYTWQVNGGELTVLMPRSVTGMQRGAWLNANVTDVETTRLFERERVQRLIDEAFPEDVSLDAYGADAFGFKPTGLGLHPLAEEGLASVVAREKAERLDELRPSIRRLGEERLQALISRIFEAHCEGDEEDKEIAGEFGLSAATFSRFAGSNWERLGTASVPDLWRNTAGVLVADADFRDAALDAGIWKVVKRLATKKDTEANHG